ncbi:ParA family protein [Phocaeicola coprophilus]|uniref:AAA domain-containing protein n=1 Tax=Phocaeicola coprophilus DSM 18228 = JCM 13818 TaxID=547042 RepID=S0F9F5_9BACT|nr:ParA family protein [Phocaeicola coprophilus]EEF75161.1 hypothetical protein BACCOPRO_00644 [Phocaeicola coprophilus DSM 18228 = JCM 13818]QRO26102.1 ParA family protein [Phocaeicola coprophilus]
MSLIDSYGLWNNKGGVGKSTITYHLATRYAEINPDKNVVVLDLCPQANSSMMLLGGGQIGENNVFNNCTLPMPKTVVGYLTTVITNGYGAALPDPDLFTTRVNTHNRNLPDNLYLLCGDGNLEPIAPAISNQANAQALTPNIQPWVWIHNIFRNYIQSFAEKHPEKDLIAFIDTNPAFGIYTELAITATNKLICPVNADDSSRTAASAMTILLHGTNPPHPVYGSWTFAAMAQKYGINIPKIHLIIGNRLTQYSGAAKAFKALSDATSQALFTIYQNNPDYFTPRSVQINDIETFKRYYSISLRDFNTAGIVTAHLGRLLNKMSENIYTIHGTNVQIDRGRINDCRDAIDAILRML